MRFTAFFSKQPECQQDETSTDSLDHDRWIILRLEKSRLGTDSEVLASQIRAEILGDTVQLAVELRSLDDDTPYPEGRY